MMVFSLILALGAASPAKADNWGKDDKTPATTAPKCGDYPGLTNMVVSCIRDTIDSSMQRYIEKFYPTLKKAIAAVMTLAVIVYGIMLSFGMVERVGRDTMILLFKLAGVVYFVSNTGFIHTSVTSLMDGAATAVVSYTPKSGTPDAASTDISKSACLKKLTTKLEEADVKSKRAGPWLAVDCLVDSVIGIKLPDSIQSVTNGDYYNDKLSNKNSGMSRSLLFLFNSGLQTSVVGLVLGILGYAFIWGLIAMIIKTIFIYLAGYIGVAFMSIISPLFIPLILFQSTRQYFDKWVKSLASFALQPVVIMAYISFAIAAIDFAAFTGDYSVWYRIAGEESRQNGFDLNSYLTAQRNKNTGAIIGDGTGAPTAESAAIVKKYDKPIAEVLTNNPTPIKSAVNQTDEGGLFRGLEFSKCTDTEIQKDTTGTLKAYCSFKRTLTVATSYVDWTMMAKARKEPAVTGNDDAKKGQQIANEVLSSLAFCAMLVFLLNGFLKLIPMIAYGIGGDYAQSANLASVAAGKWKAGGEIDKLMTPFSKIAGSKK